MSFPTQRIDLTEPPPRLSSEQLARRWAESYPEMQGPGQDDPSGRVLRGDEITAHARVGKIEPLLPPEVRDRERAEAEARAASVPPEVREARAMLEAEMRQQGRRF